MTLKVDRPVYHRYPPAAIDGQSYISKIPGCSHVAASAMSVFSAHQQLCQ